MYIVYIFNPNFLISNLVVSNLRLETKRFPVRVQLLAICRGELSSVIARLTPKYLRNRWKWLRGVKEMVFFFWGAVNRECWLKKIQIEKRIFHSTPV